MINFKKKSKLTALVALIATVICAVIASFTALFGGFGANVENASADTYGTSVSLGTGAITSTQASKLKSLFSKIKSGGTSTSSITYEALKTYMDTQGTKTGYAMKTRVSLGGYDWNVVYASENKSGDVIATLWLAENPITVQWNNWYSSSSNTWSYPSNMYGTSYIRSYLTGSLYAKSSTNGSISDSSKVTLTAGAQASEWSTFLSLYGALIDTPSKIAWQETESAVAGDVSSNYLFPNEAYGTPSTGSYYSGYDYTSKSLYTAWKNDKLWLPSFTETGYGTSTSSANGLWGINSTVRSNTESGAPSWLRSGNRNNARNAYSVHSDGSPDGYNVTDFRAVRPALHLNLKSAAIAAKMIDPDVPVASKTDFKVVSNPQTFTLSNVTGVTVSLPSGWSLNNDSGVVTFPSLAPAAMYKITCTSSTGRWSDNTTGTKTIIITISKNNNTVKITSANSVTYGSTLALNCSATVGASSAVWSVTNGTGKATVSGSTLTPTQAGVVTVKVTIPGDVKYNDGLATQEILIKKANISPTLSYSTVTYGSNSAAPTVGGNSGNGTKTFSVAAGTGSATINSSTGVLTPTQAGTVTVTVSIAATTNYNEGSKSITVTINKANISPTLSYSTVTYGSNSAAPTVGGNSGNGTKTFSVAAGTGKATINSSTGVLTPTQAGTVTVTVSIAATTNYNAGSKSITVTINKANISPTLSYSTVTYGSNSAAPTVGGNSGNGTKTFSVAAGTGTATINSSTGVLTPTQAGTVTVTVSIAATTNYNAGSKSITVTINKANQSTPTVTGNHSVTYGLSVTLTASGGNGTGAYTWSVATLSGGGAATLSATTGGSVTVTATHVGSVRVTMYRATSTNYNQSGNVTFDITVNKATPTVTATVANGTYYVGKPLSTAPISAAATHNGGNVNGAISWDVPTTTLVFDDGTVSYAWTWTPSDTANYNSVTGTAKVLALGMDDIRAEGQKTAYRAYESFTTDGMTVYAITRTDSGEMERAVTGYTVSVAYGDGRTSFLVADNGCTVTITYTEGDKTKTYSFTVTVVKADYDMTGVTLADKTVTYDGSVQTLSYTGTLPAGVTVNGYKCGGVAFTGATNAGTYVISADIGIADPDNMNVPRLGATLKIEKATATIDTSGMTKNYTYTGSLQTVSGGATASSGQEVKYADNTFTTVAEGNALQVDVYVEESTNYNEYHVTFTINVDKAATVINVSGVTTDYTYNGSEQRVDSGATANHSENPIVYSNNTFTTVAEGNGLVVTISVAESANYKAASATVTLTVHKATLSGSVTFDDLSVTFDGKSHTITATGFGGDVTVTYYYTGTTNAFTGETDVGTYSITAQFSSTSDNYEVSSADAEKTAELTITPRAVVDGDVSGIDATYEYTGLAQTPAPTVEVLLAPDDPAKTTLSSGDYSVTYSTSDADAGTVVEVTLVFSGNYSGTVKKTFTITPKQLGIKWSQDTSFTYNGQGQGMTAEFTGLVAGDVGNINPTIVYSGMGYPASSAKPTDAGTYTITVTLDAQYTNYVQFVGLTNRFTIKKATPSATVKFVSYDPSTDKLYPDNKLPDIEVDGNATAGTLTVAGHVEWKLLDNGNAQYLLLNENSYGWVFIPDDITNFEVYEDTLKLTAVQAELKTLTVQWKGGVAPTVYVSWDLAKVREYIIVTGTLEDNSPYGEISNYVISGSWGIGDRPVSAGNYDLRIVYNGKNGTLNVTYVAVELDSLKVTTPTKTSYNAFETFDTSTVTVTAVYNDGSESDVTNFTVEYRANHSYLWAGDGYVTVRYTEDGISKTYQVGGLTVQSINYDLGNISLNDVTVNYDGTLKTASITGTFAEGTVSYVYRQNGATIPGVAGVTNAGEYEVVATFTLVGDEYLTNYICGADGVIGSLTAKITVNKIDYVGVGSITFADTETDYNFGESVIGAVSVKNLPAGVTVSYAFADKDKNPLDPTQVVNAGEYFVTVTFGVDSNHNAIQPMTAKFTVNKLNPVVTPKVSGNLTKGAHLYQVLCALSDGDTAGTIVWDDDEIVLEEGINRCYYTFVPEDTVNFNTVNSFIDLNAGAGAAEPAKDGLGGWEVAIIVVCAVVTLFAIVTAAIVAAKKKAPVDDDGFNDVVTDADLW